MSEEIYDLVVELQDKVTEQGNLIADIMDDLNKLAMIWEKDNG